MLEIPDALRAALAGRYLLERELGRGGMATVYLAHDEKHHRRVAVKVLRPELAASLGAERFLKEIEIAANLQHPHILPLFDSGSVADLLYYVMPYVAGESLRGLMNREGTLAPQRTVRLVSQIAEALAYAHKHGVVHRDIKPENILLAEGHPIVADFGIAKAVSTAGGLSLTRTGFPLGTPGYMSPEQAAGLRDLDQRTDVFSLACVCYEMLIGDTPGMWLTDEAVKLGRFEDASAPHRERLDKLSGSIELVLVRALAMRLERRTPTITAFAQALDGALTDRRRFGDTDVRGIMHEAAEAEARGPETEDALTIGTVQRIGGEAGIAADLVRHAADHVQSTSGAPIAPRTTPREAPRINPLIGAPAMLRFERVVDVEVDASRYPELVDEMRSTLEDNGLVSTLGRSLTWSSTPRQTGREIHLSIVVQDGHTKILGQQNLRPIVGGLFGGIIGGAGGGGLGAIIPVLAAAAHAGGPVVAAGSAAWVGATYLTARMIFRRVSRNHAKRLGRLVDRLAEQIEAGAGRSAPRLRRPQRTPEQLTP